VIKHELTVTYFSDYIHAQIIATLHDINTANSTSLL